MRSAEPTRIVLVCPDSHRCFTFWTGRLWKKGHMRRASMNMPAPLLPVSSVLFEQRREVKAKKKPKPGQKYVDDSHKWRDNWRKDRTRQLADSLRGYMAWCSTKRTPAWDARFAPFNRQEKDGVYVIMKHMMEDKLSLANYHAKPTKKLFVNVGLLGPQVTTQARWKPHVITTLPAGSTFIEDRYLKDKTLRNAGYND